MPPRPITNYHGLQASIRQVEKARQELSDRGYLQQLYFDRACPVYRLQIKAADLGLKELITSGAAA